MKRPVKKKPTPAEKRLEKLTQYLTALECIVERTDIRARKKVAYIKQFMAHARAERVLKKTSA
jgi:hypothetical protein